MLSHALTAGWRAAHGREDVGFFFRLPFTIFTPPPPHPSNSSIFFVSLMHDSSRADPKHAEEAGESVPAVLLRVPQQEGNDGHNRNHTPAHAKMRSTAVGRALFTRFPGVARPPTPRYAMCRS